MQLCRNHFYQKIARKKVACVNAALLIFSTALSTMVTVSTLCSLSFSMFINCSKCCFHLSITSLVPVRTCSSLFFITLSCCTSFPSLFLCLANLYKSVLPSLLYSRLYKFSYALCLATDTATFAFRCSSL